jgi:hypothetical protein
VLLSDQWDVVFAKYLSIALSEKGREKHTHKGRNERGAALGDAPRFVEKLTIGVWR